MQGRPRGGARLMLRALLVMAVWAVLATAFIVFMAARDVRRR